MSYEKLTAGLNKMLRVAGVVEKVLPGEPCSDFIVGRKKKHAQLREKSQQHYEEIIDVLQTYRQEYNKQITVADVDHNQCEQILEKAFQELEDFHSQINNKHLVEEEISGLSEVESFFKKQQKYLNVKKDFVSLKKKLLEKLEAYKRITAEVSNRERYMTKKDQEVFTEYPQSIKSLYKKLTGLNLSCLSEEQQQFISETSQRIEKISQQAIDIEEYNQQFVESKIKEYSSLFTNINNSGNDLNRQQCEAIVKNDRFNQVIAAAGTGKTLVLTYRIKYLIDEGVKPERILAITYTKEAAREMKKRLKEKFAITGVEVRTIHSFSYKIVREKAVSKLSVVNDTDKKNILRTSFQEYINDSDNAFFQNFVKYYTHKDDESIDKTDFESKSDYVAAMRNKRYETLKGEEVRSQAEKAIADFLYINRVEYYYEKVADWADKAEDKVIYQPDFYLPGYDLYLEHWGVDRQGKVPEWFEWSSEKYQEKMEWAREQFEKYDKRLIETFDYEYQEGNFDLVLNKRLKPAGVKLEKMDFKEYINSVYNDKASRKNIINNFQEFIDTAKTFWIKPGGLKELLTKKNKKQYYFGLCGETLLKDYNNYLQENHLLDFNDMIYKAAEIVKNQPEKYYSQYDHMLVDEFQDVGESHINLVKQFFVDGSQMKLFCVGDDWQSIYSFQGSEPKYFIDFEDSFGTAAKTYLVENFRCPKTVLEAGNTLIDNNKRQIKKEVIARSGRDCSIKLHVLTDEESRYKYELTEYTVSLVEHIIKQGGKPGDIMILSRNDDASPHLGSIKDKLQEKELPYCGKGDNDYYNPQGDYKCPQKAVSVYSVHQSKGREAKHIIIIHAVEDDPFSFPAPDKNNELVAPLITSSIKRMEEERRLFYVAITRAEEDLHILTQKNNMSPFIEEIDDYLEREVSIDCSKDNKDDDYINFTARVFKLWPNVHQSQKQAGLLKNLSGTTVKFLSWKSCNPPQVQKGVWYKFKSVKRNEYKGELQIIIDDKSEVLELYR